MNVRPVRFERDGATLAGELTTPDGAGPWPAVVLLHGASWGLRAFYRAHVEAFCQAGIACLTFDRRGEGESEGSSEQDIFVFADDALAAFETVTRQPEVRPGRVGLWGYSNGAWGAALTASKLPSCAWLVLTGAAGVSPAESEVFRRVEDLRAHGVPQATLAAVADVWRIVFEYMVTGAWHDGWDDRLAGARNVIEADRQLDTLPIPEFVRSNPYLDSVPRFDGPIFAQLRKAGGTSPDMGVDPIVALRAVECPVLVVQAEHDANVPMAESLARFRALAEERPGWDFTVEVLPGVGHQFEPEGTTARPEWLTEPRGRDEYTAGYLEQMGAWMANRAG